MNNRKNEELRDTPLYKAMKRRAEIDDIRQANAKKRSAFTGKAARLDDCLKDDHGKNRENAAFSDRGRGAEAIIEQVAILTDGIDAIDADDVSWEEEFQKVVNQLAEEEMKILQALKRDYTDRGAAMIVGVISHMKVHRFKAKLREMLIPTYRAWKRRH